MTVTVKHSKTNSIADWTQAQLDEQIALGNFPSGTTLANIVLPSDWNNDHTLTGVGTMAEQDANNVAITGGTINNTTIGATTATTGKFTSVTTPSVTATTNDLTLSATSTGAVKFSTAGGLQMQVADIASASRYIQVKGSSSGSPEIGVPTAGTLVLYGGNTSGIAFYSNAYAQQQFGITHTASAVNYVQVTGAATTSFPIISAQGSDTNISLQLYAKGTGAVNFWTSNGGSRQFQIAHTAGTIVNYGTVTGNVAGSAPAFSVAGSDTNIDLTLTPKGTGNVRFGTHTGVSDTAISGYITIKDSGGTTRKLAVIT